MDNAGLLDHCTAAQRHQLEAFREQVLHFNKRFNLISKDTEVAFDERHLAHCVALAHKTFPSSCTVVDWGTGGGLPAIPLAILFPDVEVHAVDAVGKKIQAVQATGRRLGLSNLHPWHGRAEEWPGTTHYSVSRATAPLADLWYWHQRVCIPLEHPPPDAWHPGLICLKGGDLSTEIAGLQADSPTINVKMTPLEPLLGQSYFADKYIVEVYV